MRQLWVRHKIVILLGIAGICYFFALYNWSESFEGPRRAQKAECKEIGGYAWVDGHCADNQGVRIVLPSERL